MFGFSLHDIYLFGGGFFAVDFEEQQIIMMEKVDRIFVIQ